MSAVGPKIYHITHVENLAQIAGDAALWSDAQRIHRGLPCKLIGMRTIKRRRLEELEVGCHPGTKVGQFVPFYFCARSIMLYLLHMGNQPGLDYADGQSPIVHLEADLHAVVDWANANNRRWAFSRGNAGARYTEFFNDLGGHDQLNWAAIEANQWNDPSMKEGKQAEFLVEDSFPWKLVECVGVFDERRKSEVSDLLHGASHIPPVVVKRNWYY